MQIVSGRDLIQYGKEAVRFFGKGHLFGFVWVWVRSKASKY
jgi:hypothetical protein